MMGKIKFRGYSHEHGWVYGDLLQYPDGKVYIMEHSDGESLSYEVDRLSVGQCTGLKTRGGALIYEGDILHLPASDGSTDKYVAVWCTDRWRLEPFGFLSGSPLSLGENAGKTTWIDYSY